MRLHAQLAAETARRKQAEAERDKWLKAFNQSEQFQSGPTKRAEASEVSIAALAAALDGLARDVTDFIEHGLIVDTKPSILAAARAALTQAPARATERS